MYLFEHLNKNILMGGKAGFPLYPPHTGCVFVGGACASFVSSHPPTRNISRCFAGVPLQSLPRSIPFARQEKGIKNVTGFF